MYLFGKNSMPDVDNLLTSFYHLNDEARKRAGAMVTYGDLFTFVIMLCAIITLNNTKLVPKGIN
jgi:hypothetical protein